MNIYVASSWRNVHQPQVVGELRALGHVVYDFKDADGFGWHQIDQQWTNWKIPQYLQALKHPLAQKGFHRDMEAIKKADLVVMVQPCGCSAFMETGWASGAGKGVAIYVPETREPDLMILMADFITDSLSELKEWIQDVENNT